MAELEGVKWIADISLTLAFAAVVIYVLVKFVKKILDDHTKQLEKKDKDTQDLISKMDDAHRAEREVIMNRLNDYDIYQRELTKETYSLISSFKQQMEDLKLTKHNNDLRVEELINEKKNLSLKVDTVSAKLDILLKGNDK